MFKLDSFLRRNFWWYVSLSLCCRSTIPVLSSSRSHSREIFSFYSNDSKFDDIILFGWMSIFASCFVLLVSFRSILSCGSLANRSIDIWYHRGKMTLSKGFFSAHVIYLSNCCLFGIDIIEQRIRFFIYIGFHRIVYVWMFGMNSLDPLL